MPIQQLAYYKRETLIYYNSFAVDVCFCRIFLDDVYYVVNTEFYASVTRRGLLAS